MSWMADLIGAGGPWGVAALTLLETVFPPIPSEVVIPLAGIAAARGDMSLGGAIAGGVAGSMGGNLAFYGAARWLGARRFEGWVERHGRWLTLDRESVERARAWFARAGGWVVGAGRCVPGLRSLVSIPAGLTDMPLVPFLLWSTLGTTVWTSGLTIAGYRLGRAGIPMIEALIGPVSTGLMVLAAAIYVYRLVTWRRSA